MVDDTDFQTESRCDGEPNGTYIANLYGVFLDSYVHTPLAWKGDGAHISFRRQPSVDGRHQAFWHIISEETGYKDERRVVLERCIRISWIRTLVEVFNTEFPREDKIRWWIDKRRVSRGRHIISRAEFDYVVVIEEREKYVLFVTAYYVEHKHRRRKLKRDHDDFWEKQGPLMKERP